MMSYYGRKLSYGDIKNMSMREFHAFYYLMYRDGISKDDAKNKHKKEIVKQAMEDMEDEFSTR